MNIEDATGWRHKVLENLIFLGLVRFDIPTFVNIVTNRSNSQHMSAYIEQKDNEDGMYMVDYLSRKQPNIKNPI